MRLRAAAAAALVLVSVAWCSATEAKEIYAAKSDTVLSLHVINVGQGNCFLIECPGGGPILNDCGTSSAQGALTPRQVQTYIAKVLAQYSAKSLSVFVSHSHSDHMSLISDPTYGIASTNVGSLYIAETLSAYSTGFQNWAAGLQTVTFPRPYTAIPFAQCGKATIDILTVNSNPNTANANADSMILRVRYGAWAMYLTGDATKVAQDRALRKMPDNVLKTVMLAPHHGADTDGSNDEDWVAGTRSQVVIFSVGAHNSYRHPRCVSVDNYIDYAELSPASVHSISCGASATRTWEVRSEPLEIYATASSGTLELQVQPTGVATLSRIIFAKCGKHHRVLCRSMHAVAARVISQTGVAQAHTH